MKGFIELQRLGQNDTCAVNVKAIARIERVLDYTRVYFMDGSQLAVCDNYAEIIAAITEASNGEY